MLINAVAPFAGAWIEIGRERNTHALVRVAPFAGAWIEIQMILDAQDMIALLPSRERGLKYGVIYNFKFPPEVAPFAGAWVEILERRLKWEKFI